MRRASAIGSGWLGLEFYEITKGIKKAIWNSARGRCLLSAKLPLHLRTRLLRAMERNGVWYSARVPKEAKWINLKRSKKVSSSLIFRFPVENVEVQHCMFYLHSQHLLFTLFSFAPHSGHLPKRRLFRERGRTAGPLQSREGGVPLGPKQRFGRLGAQHQWQEIPRGGKRQLISLQRLLNLNNPASPNRLTGFCQDLLKEGWPGCRVSQL